jgi:hypothetical protein
MGEASSLRPLPALGFGLVRQAVRSAYNGSRECYQRRLLALVSAADAPATELPQVRSRRSEARAGPTFRSPAARSSPRPDRIPCACGVATQDLTAKPLAAKVHLVTLCDRFGRQRSGCVAWLAKALNVDTDGAFRAVGCPGVPVRDRAPCRAGAATWRGALETFS